MMAGGDARFHNDGKWMRLGTESCVSMLLLSIAQDVGFVSSKSEFHDLQGIVISSPLTILVAGSLELSKKFILEDLRWFWQVACPEKYEILL